MPIPYFDYVNMSRFRHIKPNHPEPQRWKCHPHPSWVIFYIYKERNQILESFGSIDMFSRIHESVEESQNIVQYHNKESWLTTSVQIHGWSLKSADVYYFPSKRRPRWLAPFTLKFSSSTSSWRWSRDLFCLHNYPNKNMFPIMR